MTCSSNTIAILSCYIRWRSINLVDSFEFQFRTSQWKARERHKQDRMAKVQPERILSLALVCIIGTQLAASRAASTGKDADSVSAVIPSPNDDYGESQIDDIRRMTAADIGLKSTDQSSASKEAPIYVSPFARPARSMSQSSSSASSVGSAPQESSHAPAKYAAASSNDLKTSASYGYHGHGHHGYGYGPSGWLDMGAWTGGKGSFGWYADYPVGGHKHHGY